MTSGEEDVPSVQAGASFSRISRDDDVPDGSSMPLNSNNFILKSG